MTHEQTIAAAKDRLRRADAYWYDVSQRHRTSFTREEFDAAKRELADAHADLQRLAPTPMPRGTK